MRCRNTGIALVAVLWIVSALSILAAGIAYASRIETRQTQFLRDRAVAAALGDGAINLAIAERRTDAEAAQAFLHQYEIDGHEITVEVTPVSGLVNLNEAADVLLRDTFQYAAGLDEETATELAIAVVEWRDPAHIFDGGEPGMEPTHGRPFLVNEDLRQVPGVTPDIYASLSRLIHVYRGSGGIDANAAPAGVLNILAEGDPNIVEEILARRNEDDPLTDFTRLNQQNLGGADSTHYRLDALIKMDDGSQLRRTRWIDLATGWRHQPWQVVRVEPVIGVSTD